MNVKNCSKCGKIFNYVAGPAICPTCKKAAEDTFQMVKKYVQEHKGASVSEVAEECEVSPQQIRQWVREERLEFADSSMIGIACEKCGATIKSGRFCDKCKMEMVNGFQSAMPQKPEPKKEEPKSKENPKMRFL